MLRATDFATQLSASSLSRAKVRAFANHVAKVEAGSGVTVKRVLTNGIPPFERIPAAEFSVPRNKLGKVLELLLSDANINPNVMIDGIPAVDQLRVMVMGR